MLGTRRSTCGVCTGAADWFGTGITAKLRDYSVHSVSVGEDAQGEARVEIEHNGRIQRGQAVSTDIIEASALAFLQVINRALLREQIRMNPQTESVIMS